MGREARAKRDAFKSGVKEPKKEVKVWSNEDMKKAILEKPHEKRLVLAEQDPDAANGAPVVLSPDMFAEK